MASDAVRWSQHARYCALLGYRVLAAIMTLIVFGGIIYHAVDLFRNVPVVQRYGLVAVPDPDTGVRVVDTSSDAATAGVRVGDQIAVIDGHRLPSRPTMFDLGAKLSAASPIARLGVVHKNQAAAIVSVRRSYGVWTRRQAPSNLPLWLTTIALFFQLSLPPLILLSASFLLYKRRPHDREAMLLAACFLTLCFSVENWMATFGAPPWLATAIYRTGMSLTMVAVVAFPDGRLSSWWEQIAALAALSSAIFYLPFAARSDSAAISMLEAQAMLLYLSIGLTALAVLMRYRRLGAGLERQQIKWMLVGAVVTAMVLTVVGLHSRLHLQQHLLPPALFGLDFVDNLLFTTALPIGLLVSVLRYRLYDSEAAVTRSTAFAALTLSLLAVFAASENLLSGLGNSFVTGEIGAFPGALAAAVTVMTIAPLHTRLKFFAEQRFRRELFDMREHVPLLVGDMRETESLDVLATATVERIKTGMRARAVALILDGKLAASQGVTAEDVDRWLNTWVPKGNVALDCNRSDAVFPLRMLLSADGSGAVGWLLLGPRPDGSFYGKDERAAICKLADPVARAVHIIQLRDTNATSIDRRIARLEQALTGLAASSSDARRSSTT